MRACAYALAVVPRLALHVAYATLQRKRSAFACSRILHPTLHRFPDSMLTATALHAISHAPRRDHFTQL